MRPDGQVRDRHTRAGPVIHHIAARAQVRPGTEHRIGRVTVEVLRIRRPCPRPHHDQRVRARRSLCPGNRESVGPDVRDVQARGVGTGRTRHGRLADGIVRGRVGQEIDGGSQRAVVFKYAEVIHRVAGQTAAGGIKRPAAGMHHIVSGPDLGSRTERGAGGIVRPVHREAVHGTAGLGHHQPAGPVAVCPADAGQRHLVGARDHDARRLRGRLRHQRGAAGRRLVARPVVGRVGAVEFIDGKGILRARRQRRHRHVRAGSLVHHVAARGRRVARSERRVGGIHRAVGRIGRRRALPGHHQHITAVAARPADGIGRRVQIAEDDIRGGRGRFAQDPVPVIRCAEIAQARAGAVGAPHPVVVILVRIGRRVVIADGIGGGRVNDHRRPGHVRRVPPDAVAGLAGDIRPGHRDLVGQVFGGRHIGHRRQLAVAGIRRAQIAGAAAGAVRCRHPVGVELPRRRRVREAARLRTQPRCARGIRVRVAKHVVARRTRRRIPRHRDGRRGTAVRRRHAARRRQPPVAAAGIAGRAAAGIRGRHPVVVKLSRIGRRVVVGRHAGGIGVERRRARVGVHRIAPDHVARLARYVVPAQLHLRRRRAVGCRQRRLARRARRVGHDDRVAAGRHPERPAAVPLRADGHVRRVGGTAAHDCPAVGRRFAEPARRRGRQIDRQRSAGRHAAGRVNQVAGGAARPRDVAGVGSHQRCVAAHVQRTRRTR